MSDFRRRLPPPAEAYNRPAMSSGKASRPKARSAGCPEEGSSETRFRSVCLKHLPALYGMALHLTRNASDAEDLVQETYLKAVRSSSTFAADRDCRAWLFKIMTNAFIDQYRKNVRAPEMVEFEEGDEHAVAGDAISRSHDAPEEALLSSLMDEDVQRALDGLPENFRVPVLLFDVQGFTYAEIADMLSVPVGTVMSRLYRGRRLLKKSLVDYARSRGYVG